MEIKLSMKLLDEVFSICRMNKNDKIPEWVMEQEWFSITKTDEELSIVCQESYTPQDIKREQGWRCLKVLGPLDFGLIGIIASISKILAENNISIFVVSTYDTDYVLVKESMLERTIKTLNRNGFNIIT